MALKVSRDYLRSNHKPSTFRGYKYLIDNFQELQSRCEARIGEVLNTRVKDIDGRKIILHNLKSRKEKEAIFTQPLSPLWLRHQNLKTTHVYLARLSDSEAIRWMDILHGR